MALFNYNRITPQIKKMIQDKLKSKGLVNSGTLVNSIEVIATNSGFSVKGVDYWEFINKKYKIMDEILNSKEFGNLLINETISQLDTELTIRNRT